MTDTTNPTAAPVPQDTRSAVEQGYDQCSAAYTATRSHDTVRELSILTSRLPRSATILDLGCGAGIPVALTLASHANHYHVTGVDISLEQIKRARINVPAATFHHADMTSPSLDAALGGPGSFDAAVAFFSIFHLPRAMHADMFRRIAHWLKPGGYLLATTAAAVERAAGEDEGEGGEGHVENFYGAQMYWSSHSHAAYRDILAEAGFEVLENRDGGESEGEGEVFETATSAVDAGKAQHPLLFARKKG